jgi:hypothetical protein
MNRGYNHFRFYFYFLFYVVMFINIKNNDLWNIIGGLFFYNKIYLFIRFTNNSKFSIAWKIPANNITKTTMFKKRMTAKRTFFR